nr:heterogeneous nuclear ribonucleoprotein 1 [Tanacetum cinerariifolium]
MIGAYPYGLGRTSNFVNGYTQGLYSPGGVGGYGLRMDSRFSPVPNRSGFAPFGSGYGMGLNFEPGMTSPNYNRNLSYGRGISPSPGPGPGPSPYFVGNSNRFAGPIGFDGGNGGNASFFSSTPRNLWSNGGSSGAIGGGILGNTGLSWGSAPANSSTQSGNLGYGGSDNSYGLGSGGFGRNGATSGVQTSSYAANNGSYEGPFSDFYGGGNGSSGSGGGVGSVYSGDPTWRSGNNEQEGSGSFGGYGIGGGGDGSDVQNKHLPGYVGGYSVAKRHPNRGISG